MKHDNDSPIWTPSPERIKHSLLTHFMAQCDHDNASYQDFWQWSIEYPEAFWNQLWDFCDIIGDKGDITIQHADTMTGGQFYPNGTLNYAQNILRRKDDAPAIIFRDETGAERSLSFAQLNEQVSLWAQAFIDSGIEKGDRIAACMPNMPETIIACLAASSIGAVWASASPDFGEQGLLDRFGQIEPNILITVDGYYYGGKTIDCLDKAQNVAESIKSLKQVIIVPFIHKSPQIDTINKGILQDHFIAPFTPKAIDFAPLPFNHPLFIMFSSGTTGVPKCIVHGHGGTLLQHMKEHQLHCDIKPDDRVFYFTTCGWMMWNWLISALGSGATLLLYDGNPFYPDGNVLWDFAEKHQCTLFGTAAKYIDALKKHNYAPKETHDLSALRTITSTGSPLVHESFDYVYSQIKQDVHLASISGGTDIVSCFMLGNPISPVYRGEIQGAGLGLALSVLNDDGTPCAPTESGELTCTKPFPCMPIGFWNDPEGKKYKSAYFDSITLNDSPIWAHGDWVEITQNHGYIIHGRSDATLNPGGVRIGTAEIYRQVEKIPEIIESMAVGHDKDGDTNVILFVIVKEGYRLDDDLTKQIKQEIRQGASPRHVPTKVIQVPDIPRTKSGKITEIAVRHIIHGREVKNKESLANPEALEFYKDLTL